MNPLRILFGAILLALATLVGFVLASRRPAPPSAAPAAALPVMDLGDESTREAAVRLMSSAPRFNGEWLGAHCRASEEERYVLSRSDPVTWVARRALFVLGSGSGRFHFDARPMSPDPTVELGRAWTLDAGATNEFRRILAQGDYFSLPPAGEVGYCHTEIVSLEACVGGRYYGVVRMCEGGPTWDGLMRSARTDPASTPMPAQGSSARPPAPLRDLADSIEALMDRVSEHDTRRQVERAIQASPITPPAGD